MPKQQQLVVGRVVLEPHVDRPDVDRRLAPFRVPGEVVAVRAVLDVLEAEQVPDVVRRRRHL